MQKEMKSKLYSHFVKSGTLMGGNFTKEAEEGFLEVFFYCFKKSWNYVTNNKVHPNLVLSKVGKNYWYVIFEQNIHSKLDNLLDEMFFHG